MRILVTGANGFVGGALARRFAGEGRPLTLATRHGREIVGASSARTVASGAIGPGTEWGPALDGAGIVVHAAARVHVAPERAAREAPLFDAVNRLGTVRLYEAAAQAGVQLFVFVSSITVLGPGKADGSAFRDDDPAAPETVYAGSKAGAESDLRRLAREGGAPALVILRPPLVAGRGAGGNLAALLRLARLPVPLPLGGLSNRRTLLSLPNLVEAIGRAVDHPDPPAVAGTYNLGDADALSTSDIVRALRRGMGRPPGLLPCPAVLQGTARRMPGLGGVARRLLDDLAVDSSGFRSRFGFRDGVDTTDTLAAMAAPSADA